MTTSKNSLTRSQFLRLSGGALAAAATTAGLAACGGTVSTTGNTASTSSGGTAASTGGAQEINLYTWQEYVPPRVVSGFEEETGITVNYSYFSSNEEMLAKLEATGGADYDVILCTDYIIKLAGDEGLLQTIDTSKIDNYKNVDPRLEKQYFDPDGNLSIPYWVAKKAIIFDPARTDLTFESFTDLTDSSLASNVVLQDSEREVIGTAIATVGGDYNTQDVDEIESARSFLLDELRPSVEAFNSDSPEYAVVNGDAIAAFTNASQCISGIIADDSMKWTYPKESTVISIDAFVVPSQAPHLDNVYTFLNYVLRGDVAAIAVEHTHYHNSNISDEYKEGIQEYVDQDHVALIPDDVLDNYELPQTLDTEAQQAYDDLWTAFKQG